MNTVNYDEKIAVRPINSILIDKPQLKPIDLLVERPIDANIGRPASRIPKPIVERYIEHTFDSFDDDEEDEDYNDSRDDNPRDLDLSKERNSKEFNSRERNSREQNPNDKNPIEQSARELETRDKVEPLMRPKVKPAIKLKERTSTDKENEKISAQEREKRRKNARKKTESTIVENLSKKQIDENDLSIQILGELDNPDVVAKIKSIIDDNTETKIIEVPSTINKELELQNKTLNDQLEKALLEIKKLKKIAVNLKEEKNEYMDKNESLISEHKNMLSKVQKFEYDQKMFRLFTLLNPEVKLSLRGIFKIDTYENFIACGAQRSNIDSLWDFAKNRVQKQQFDEIETLNQILLYFIDIFNQTSNSPTIKIQEVTIGHNFDTENHIKSSDSIKPAGSISKIYLLGYQNVSNDKILNKAIVLIGG